MFTSGLIISDCAILLPGAVKGFEVWNSCKPEEHMKQNDRFCSKQGLVRNEDNNLQHFMVTVSQSKLLKKEITWIFMQIL
jgi:hypothetical protein